MAEPKPFTTGRSAWLNGYMSIDEQYDEWTEGQNNCGSRLRDPTMEDAMDARCEGG